MTTLSTHVLDTSSGEPVRGLEVHLALRDGQSWAPVTRGFTDDDGRLDLGEVDVGRHRLGFETGEAGNHFYPYVHVVFEIGPDRAHYHVPLLLSPYGYTTYRGS